ncbi:hypothetical protein [Kitasatospora sp. NPDC058046]|uniref:hypothetical protein n=1 Tax=Kitasatospora sp. NPDC058046 TaxID=3346312 RepID=UPI0036DB2D7D
MSARHVNDHPAAAAMAEALPGQWVYAGEFGSSLSAKSSAAAIRDGRLPAYHPAGAFDAYAAPTTDADVVWVRYVGHGQPVQPLPDRMTVRVADRGDGSRGYEGVWVVTVTISTRCAQCGGPRGWDTVRAHRQSEDGDWFTVDQWRNPCGHIDMYAAVLRESRLRPLPAAPAPKVEGRPVLDPAQVSAPVALILKAVAETKWLHGQQAAHLLTQHGHVDAAAALQTELAARDGHMSARQAAEFLNAFTTTVPTTDLTEGSDR